MVEGQGIGAHDVHVRLREFAEATVLRALPPPDPLNLIPLEREVDPARVLQDVPREGNRQVEVEAQTRFPALLALQTVQDVDLLGGLPLAQELVERFDGARLDPGESVELEGRSQGVEDPLFDEPVLGQPLRDT